MLETKDNIFLIKIEPTLFRNTILSEAHIMLETFERIEQIENFSKDKIQILIIVPAEMDRAGKLAAKKIPLLKFDSKNNEFTNWQYVLADLDKIHQEELNKNITSANIGIANSGTDSAEHQLQ